MEMLNDVVSSLQWINEQSLITSQFNLTQVKTTFLRICEHIDQSVHDRAYHLDGRAFTLLALWRQDLIEAATTTLEIAPDDSMGNEYNTLHIDQVIITGRNSYIDAQKELAHQLGLDPTRHGTNVYDAKDDHYATYRRCFEEHRKNIEHKYALIKFREDHNLP